MTYSVSQTVDEWENITKRGKCKQVPSYKWKKCSCQEEGYEDDECKVITLEVTCELEKNCNWNIQSCQEGGGVDGECKDILERGNLGKHPVASGIMNRANNKEVKMINAKFYPKKLVNRKTVASRTFNHTKKKRQRL